MNNPDIKINCEIAEHEARAALEKRQLEQALTILMQAYGRQVFRFCYSLLGCRDDAQDVLQTVFIQAHKGFDTFDGNSTFRTWLFAIARHRCLDHLKSARRLKAHLDFVEALPEWAADGETGEFDEKNLRHALRYCLGKLAEGVRTAVVLRLQMEHSYEEIAHIVQDKANTLQARVARALPALRRCVEQRGISL